MTGALMLACGLLSALAAILLLACLSLLRDRERIRNAAMPAIDYLRNASASPFKREAAARYLEIALGLEKSS